MRLAKRTVLVWALVCIMGFVAYAFLDQQSILNSAVRDIPGMIGLAPDSSASDVLRTMQKYERGRRYDDAIKAGVDWTKKYPTDGFNDLVFRRIAWLYLEKAKGDPTNLEDYVNQALVYRDKALPLAQDTRFGWASIDTIRDLALISESAGDLFRSQRCVQYRNATKLLERFVVLAQEKQVEAAHPRVSSEDHFTTEDVSTFINRANTALSRIRDKQKNAGCE